MTLERVMRVLAADGLIPVGGVGRRTPDFNSDPLANVVLAMGATQPSEAAETVRLLSGFRRVTNALTNIGRAPPLFLPTISPDASFFELIRGFIEELADPNRAAELRSKFGGERYHQLLTFRISTDARRVFVSIPNGTKENTFEVYAPSKSEHMETQPRRIVEVQLDFYTLEAAGILLANTLARQSILIPEPAPASAGNGSDVFGMNEATSLPAGGLDAEPPASRAYPALVPTASEQGQSATNQPSKQLLRRSVARESQVRQPATVRTRHHGANWSAASPA